MTAKECGIITRKSGAKKLVLTHFYPVASDKERLQEAKKEFRNTIIARDLMKINI
jgi:ribonuclease BN (tRNA processing enzyme)